MRTKKIQKLVFQNYIDINCRRMKQVIEDQTVQLLKINKIKYFIQHNDQKKPKLPSNIGIRQLLREYLNDDDFQILWRDEPALGSDEYEHILQQIYNQWRVHQFSNENLDDFILFWAEKQQELKIKYSLYDQIIQELKQNYPRKKFQDFKKHENYSIIKEVGSKLKSKIKTYLNPICSINKIDQQQVTPIDYLNKYFIHFAKKHDAIVNKATFNEYEQYYNSLSLSKWMIYARDIGLIKHSKRLNVKKMKQIFIKYENKQKVLSFELFKKAIDDVMAILFGDNQQNIKNQGYILLGIKNQRAFQEKFRTMGMLAPVYYAKPNNIYIKSSQTEQTLTRNASLMKKVNRLKYQKSMKTQLNHSTIQTICRLSQSGTYLPHLKGLRNTNSQKINNIEQSSRLMTEQANSNTIDLYSLQKVSMLHQKQKKRKYDQCLLQSIIKDQEDDPYLKRYNSKQNYRYHCVVNRIDQRIQKIAIKY